MARDILKAIDEVNRLRRSTEYKKLRHGTPQDFEEKYQSGPLEWARIYNLWRSSPNGVMVALRDHPFTHWVTFHPVDLNKGKVEKTEHPFSVEICPGNRPHQGFSCWHEEQRTELKPEFKEALRRAGYELKYHVDVTGPSFDQRLRRNVKLNVPMDLDGNIKANYEVMRKGKHVGTIEVSYPPSRVEANYFWGLSANGQHVKPLVKILFGGNLLRKETRANFEVVEEKRLPTERREARRALSSRGVKLLPAGRRK